MDNIIIDMMSDIHDSSTSSSESSLHNTSSIDTCINIKYEDIGIQIKNIEEEESLIEYTDNQFKYILNTYNEENEKNIEMKILSTTNIKHFCSDSPLTMSANNSDSDDDDYRENNQEFANINTQDLSNNTIYKKLTYNDVEKSLSKYYDKEDKYSSEIDILITYLKGQKVLYKYSNRITLWKLNSLTIPSIMLTAALAIFAPFMEDFSWSIGFIAALNGLITFFISLINYLKLESSAEMYLHLANQFDKLETSMEFSGNKIAFIENEKEQKKIVLKKINELERKMAEIKELNNVLIPNELKKLFPVIFHINVFSFIKKIELSKKKLIMKFKDIKNEIKYILCKWDHSHYEKDSFEMVREKNRLEYLLKIKENMKDELCHYNNAYSCIDSIFMKETYFVEKNNIFMCLLFLNKKENYKNIRDQNPVVNNHLEFIINDM
jgi:6-pyruvoyl-tetrahydropterin synthase